MVETFGSSLLVFHFISCFYFPAQRLIKKLNQKVNEDPELKKGEFLLLTITSRTYICVFNLFEQLDKLLKSLSQIWTSIKELNMVSIS